jgi:hypothetical protein
VRNWQGPTTKDVLYTRELAIGRELRILSSYGDGEDDDRL